MTIGELSRRTQVSVRMLRYYEEQGLLAPARRRGGYRDYGAEDLEVVRRIRFLSGAGLTLSVVRRFLPCLRSDRKTFIACEELRDLLRTGIRKADDEIEGLGQGRAVLASMLLDMEG